jgi:hypothetical protein
VRVGQTVPDVRQRLLRTIVRVPLVGRFYLKALLRAIEKTPRSKLPLELQQLRGMLDRVPPDQRLGLLQASMRGQAGQPEAQQLGRSMRRAAEREAWRRR